MKNAIMGILLAIGACNSGQSSEQQSQPQVGRWSPLTRPAAVIIDENLAPVCRGEVIKALQFWEEHGVTYMYLSPQAAGHPALNGLSRQGEIGLTFGQPVGSPKTQGSTIPGLINDMAVLADITIRPKACNVWVISHELGHALGLEHDPDNGNLMYEKDDFKGWTLTPTQLFKVQ